MKQYKTIVQDVVPDLDAQAALDEVINEYCAAGWSVEHVGVIVLPYLESNRGEEPIIQKIYTLSRPVASEDGFVCIFAETRHLDSINNFIARLK